MSNLKHSLREWMILVALIIAALLVGVWFFGRQIVNSFGVASSAAVGNAAEHEAHTASQNKYNAMSDEKAGRFSDVSDINSDSKMAAPTKECYAPSFKGRQPGRGPQPIAASTIEDEPPIPPDGGNMPSKELKPVQRKGIGAPRGIDSDF